MEFRLVWSLITATTLGLLPQGVFSVGSPESAIGGLREPLSSSVFSNATQFGTAKWSCSTTDVTSYSWSYGMPGLLVFGTKETTAAIQATMLNGEFGPHGYQGVALAVPDITRATSNPSFYSCGGVPIFVRYAAWNRRVELMDAFPLKWEPVAYSADVQVDAGSLYTLRLDVQAGKRIVVHLNGEKVLEHELAKPLSGNFALVAANGSFLFRNVSFEKGNATPFPDGPVVVPEPPNPDLPQAFRGHRYLAVWTRLTWREAKKACEKAGGYLVTLSDAEENAFVQKLCKGRNAWIGLTNESHGKEWRWVDGSEMEFNGFAESEPNNQGGVERYAHYCFRTDKFLADAWNDLPNDDGGRFIRGYICEWEN
jgi:hypothetical protein